MTHEYKFISPEQTLADWKAGKIQCEHLGKGRSDKLNMLLGTDVEGIWDFYKKIIYHPYYDCLEIPFPNLPSIPTDTLYEMIKGEGMYAENDVEKIYAGMFGGDEEEGELVGYKLNGKISADKIRLFLDCQTDKICPLTDKKLIQRASDLGILSACFKPVYKEMEVVVELENKYRVTVKKESVEIINCNLFIPITDLKKIIEAHSKL